MMPVETVALVTGANKGVGLATARQLAERGLTVLLGSRDVDRGVKAAAELATAGVTVTDGFFDDSESLPW